MKRTTIFPVISILFILLIAKGFPIFIKDRLVAKLIKSEASVNRKLPREIDKYTTLIEVKMGPGLKVEQVYQVFNIDVTRLDSSGLDKYNKDVYKRNYEYLMKQPQAKLFRKYGGQYLISSLDKSDSLFSQVPISFKTERPALQKK